MAVAGRQNRHPADAYRRNGRHQLYNARRKRGWTARKLACATLVAVIFVGMFAQVYSLALLMGQQKQIVATTRQIRELKSQKENLEVALNQYKRLDLLSERAAKLGMVQPDAESVRLVSVTMESTQSDTNAQTAFGGEGGQDE
ncbi:MAG: septum formation initiator family protein [Clostridia bacterium]|nr:septum formation initiator family protein [Clostridia bacterium]